MPNNGNRDGKPISSALLRRLAEAADGYRNVGPVVFLARSKANPQSPTNLFDISAGYPPDVVEQAEVQLDAGAEVSVLASVLEPLDQPKFEKYKEGKETPDPEFDLYGPFETDDGKRPGVVLTEIILKVKDVATGKETEVTIPASTDGKSTFDCMFWSLSAVQKFATPYYTRVSGTEVANQMEASFVADTFFCSVHKPITEWINIACPVVGDAPPNEFASPSKAMGKGFKVMNGRVQEFDVAM